MTQSTRADLAFAPDHPRRLLVADLSFPTAIPLSAPARARNRTICPCNTGCSTWSVRETSSASASAPFATDPQSGRGGSWRRSILCRCRSCPACPVGRLSSSVASACVPALAVSLILNPRDLDPIASPSAPGWHTAGTERSTWWVSKDNRKDVRAAAHRMGTARE